MFKLETTITNCTLSLSEQAKQLLAVELQKLDGKKVVFKLEQKRNVRSILQNSYYHGVILKLIAENAGNKDNDVQLIHESLKEMFIPAGKRTKNLFTGGYRLRRRTTTDLTTLEMEEYMSKIRSYFSAEFGLFIPLPREYESLYLV
jgi:ADP-heptose:LPS heptosyltransferase